MALRDYMLGNVDRLDGEGLARGARRGSEPYAVRCVRALGERDEDAAAEFLPTLLADPRTAMRVATANALGHLGRARSAAALVAALLVERSEEGRLSMAVAATRCGAPASEQRAALATFDSRVVATGGGPRAPSTVNGAGTLADRFDIACPDQDRRAIRQARKRDAKPDPNDEASRRGWMELAALRHPDDFDSMKSLLQSAGRRGEHALLAALGLHGDPRALPFLLHGLSATDVDPGRGFAQRRVCATALGRLALCAAVPSLLRALENEAADYEGRPGAGLGIQYPVRTNLLWALGEIGDRRAIPALVAHLGDEHGSPMGGFYLTAMDALAKLGPAAHSALRAAAANSGPGATHARTVLGTQ